MAVEPPPEGFLSAGKFNAQKTPGGSPVFFALRHELNGVVENGHFVDWIHCARRDG